MRTLGLILALTALVAGAAVADTSVQTIRYPVAAGTYADTDWAPQGLVFNQHNSALGALLSVQVDLLGEVSGDVGVENTSTNSSSTATTELKANVFVQDPGGGTLVTVLPTAQNVDNLTIFDTIIDFGGTSGKSYTGLYNSDTDTNTYTPGDGAVFSQFQGVGTITLNAFANATSAASGGGNLTSQFNTDAAGEVTITYTYRSGIPEPGTFALFGLGILGIGAVIRRRRYA